MMEKQPNEIENRPAETAETGVELKTGKWNYRVIDFGTHKALHEVFYDEHGAPNGWTDSPASFVCDEDEGASAITNALAIAAYDAGRLPMLRLVDNRLVSANLVHRADLTPMMIQKAVDDAAIAPAREIALRVRKSMMAELPDDVIGAIREGHIAFGTACAFEALTGASQ